MIGREENLLQQIEHLLGSVSPLWSNGIPIVLTDGAMTTWLHQLGVPIRTCAEELNLSLPAWVLDVHRAYVAAGSNVIQTNTFSAHRSGLERYGLGDKVAEINRAGAKIALQAAGDKAAVYGTIGSIAGVNLHGLSMDTIETAELQTQYRDQAQALLQEPIAGLVLETFPDLAELLLAIQVVKQLTDLPIVATLSPEEVGVTRDGIRLHEAFSALYRAGAAVVGLNCKLGPNGILRSYEKNVHHLQWESVKIEERPLLAAVPNAGLLNFSEGNYSYTGNETYFAQTMDELIQLGVQWIGGCCGTTPAYIHKIAEQLSLYPLSEKSSSCAQLNSENQSPLGVYSDTSVAKTVAQWTSNAQLQEKSPHPALQRSQSISVPVSKEGQAYETRVVNRELSIVDKVKLGTTIIVELDPPKTLDCSKYIEGAQQLRFAGADFITMADNSLGTVRMSNMALASVLKQHDIEPLVHVTCRDRNLIGQQSHLMGMHLLDVHHILLVTGDPSKFGDLPGATSVYDVSSIELTKMVRRLNEGIGFSGQPLKQPSRFVIGTSFNPHVRNFEKALDRLKRKVDAGADYVMTQPVFEERIMENLAKRTMDLDVPIFIGMMPLVSSRNALFLHHEVPGIDIPEDILTRMQNVDVEAATAEGLRIAEELLIKANMYFRGIYLVTPFLRYELTTHLTRFVRAQSSVISNQTV